MTAAARQIQIISDEVMMLMAISRAYRNSTVDVITAGNKAQALKQLEIFQFQVLLLDLDIKDQSGFELLQTVSRNHAGVPVILLTTGDSRAPELLEQIQACRPYGCWHVMEKPFELKKLTGAIERGLLEHTFDDSEAACSLPLPTDLRRCRRFARKEPINISLRGDAAPPFFPATLTDISVSGIGLATSTPLPTQQRISFDEKFMHQSGVVVWSIGAAGGFRAGVRFT